MNQTSPEITARADMSRPLQVGIIGASARGGWARESHVPAVQALHGLELGAVVTTTKDGADAAAKAFGVRVGYADPQALFDDPVIDIVTVAVKVPDHHDLVLGALRAGKHVYCEWPLSPTLAQAEELAAAAREAGVKVALGLQARMNPAARRAARLVADGAIGRLLGARCYSTCAAWGGEIDPGMIFAEKPDAGVNLVIIQGAHSIDLAIALVGGLADVGAIAVRQYPEPQVKGEGRNVRRETFDHLLATANLSEGGTLAVEVVGGRPADATPFRLEITGEKGELALTGGAPRGFQSGRLALTLNGELQAVDEGELASVPDAAVGVGAVYAALRDDIAGERTTVPNFSHAVRLTRLVEDMLASSADDRRRQGGDWPRTEATHA